jgi:hypothetical protein
MLAALLHRYQPRVPQLLQVKGDVRRGLLYSGYVAAYVANGWTGHRSNAARLFYRDGAAAIGQKGVDSEASGIAQSLKLASEVFFHSCHVKV